MEQFEAQKERVRRRRADADLDGVVLNGLFGRSSRSAGVDARPPEDIELASRHPPKRFREQVRNAFSVFSEDVCGPLERTERTGPGGCAAMEQDDGDCSMQERTSSVVGRESRSPTEVDVNMGIEVEEKGKQERSILGKNHLQEEAAALRCGAALPLFFPARNLNCDAQDDELIVPSTSAAPCASSRVLGHSVTTTPVPGEGAPLAFLPGCSSAG